jgi:hypothetical protein
LLDTELREQVLYHLYKIKNIQVPPTDLLLKFNHIQNKLSGLATTSLRLLGLLSKEPTALTLAQLSRAHK